jgi:diacylglycerol kinase family enzyme
MLRVMGPLEKGKHIGRWGKITMEPCKKFEIKALDSQGKPTEEQGHNPPLYISLDGEISMTTPVKFEFHKDQLDVRGGSELPNY